MSKKKDPMALFEILSKQDNPESATKVPAWMKRKPAEQAEPETPNVPDDAADEAIEETPAPPEESLAEPETGEDEPDTKDLDTQDTDEDVEEDHEEIDEDLPDDQIDEDEIDDEDEDLDDNDITEYDDDDLPEETSDAPPTPGPIRPAMSMAPLIPGQPVETPVEPWLDVSDQRVRLSLSMLTACIAAGCILVAIIMAFTFGRLTAPDAPATSAGDVAPPTADVTPPPLGNQDRPAMVATTTGQRSPDRQYLIIETLQGAGETDLAEADRIVAFVGQRGLPADIKRTGRDENAKYVVWSLQGFLDHESPEANAFVQDVERIGEAYFNQYGTYRFRQERQGQPQPFWVSGKQER